MCKPADSGRGACGPVECRAFQSRRNDDPACLGSATPDPGIVSLPFRSSMLCFNAGLQTPTIQNQRLSSALALRAQSHQQLQEH